jgi:hypothetical protein
MQAASKMEDHRSPQTCGAYGLTGKPGESLHCFDHCLDFIKADPDVRLRQVMKHGNCTICTRDYDTAAHLTRAARRHDKLQSCGVYDKDSGTSCTSIQSASFHRSATHKKNLQRSLHIRAYPQDANSLRDTDKDNMIGDWQKSATKSRAEEIKEALIRLKEPEVDGDRVLLLVQEVTAVSSHRPEQDAAQIKHNV